MSGLQIFTLNNDFFKVLLVQKVKIFVLIFEVPNLWEYFWRSIQLHSLLTGNAVSWSCSGIVAWAGTLGYAVHSRFSAEESASHYF